MTEDLLSVMRARFPQLFASENLREIACFSGWLDLLDNLCRELENYLAQNPSVPSISVRQVKEKFGGLRFYISGGDAWCHATIAVAQHRSLGICEICGQSGCLIGEKWVSVRCSDHTDDSDPTRGS
jgi:hypothetical protein